MTRSPGSVASADELVERATEQADLNDFGPSAWREGLEMVVASLAESPDYTADGRDYVQGLCVKALWNRLRVVDYAQRHPEVRDEAIRRPFVILGMPRTGTTLVSNLLDQDDRLRSLLNWEAVDSIPPPSTATLHTDPRCLTKLERQRVVEQRLVAEGTGTPHWEWADSPTECLFVQGQDFKALRWDSFLLTESYAQWLYQCDMTSAYEYEKLVLQILQSHAPGTWSLKMPSHAVFIDTLVTTFPDTRIIWTHRDPYRATGSLCSVFDASSRVVGTTDRASVARRAVDQIRRHVEQPLSHPNLLTSDRVFHLHYAEVMRDPIGEMRRLYAWAGEELTPATADRMQRWLLANPPDRFGARPYALREYGLEKADLVPVFADYIAMFDIEMEESA
jgi:hypothetical protein